MPYMAVLHSPFCALAPRGAQVQYHCDLVDAAAPLEYADALALIAAGRSVPVRAADGTLTALPEADWAARLSNATLLRPPRKPVARPRRLRSGMS